MLAGVPKPHERKRQEQETCSQSRHGPLPWKWNRRRRGGFSMHGVHNRRSEPGGGNNLLFRVQDAIQIVVSHVYSLARRGSSKVGSLLCRSLRARNNLALTVPSGRPREAAVAGTSIS